MVRPPGVTFRKLLRKIQSIKPERRATVSDVVGTIGRSQAIPRVVFQAAETRNIQYEHFRAVQGFRSVNNNLDFVDFDRPAQENYMKTSWGDHEIFEVYRRCLFDQMRHNIFRYCIVFEKGGYSVDLDTGADNRISNLHDPECAALVFQTENVASIAPESAVTNSFVAPLLLFDSSIFGFTPEHPALSEVINHCVQYSGILGNDVYWSPKRAISSFTGDGGFTKALRQFVSAKRTNLGASLCVASPKSAFFVMPQAIDRQEELDRIDTVRFRPILKGFEGKKPSSLEPKRSEEVKVGPRRKVPREIQDQAAQITFETHIPSRLIQTGPSRLIDALHLEGINQFRELNPDLSHYFFDEEAADFYMESHWSQHPVKNIYDSCLYGAMKADVFRYCVIYDLGGYYLDLNKSVDARLSQLLGPHDRALISWEGNAVQILPEVSVARSCLSPAAEVIQWCFGFEPSHKVLELAINRIVDLAPLFEGQTFRSVRQAIFAFTGPGLFTWAVRNFLAHQHGPIGITQVPERFRGTAIYRLPSSERAFAGKIHYGGVSHSPILKSFGH